MTKIGKIRALTCLMLSRIEEQETKLRELKAMVKDLSDTILEEDSS